MPIRSMTTAQTRRVQDAVVPATRQWLEDHGATAGRFAFVCAIADLGAQRYIALTEVAYSTDASDRTQWGRLRWLLDDRFTITEMPEEQDFRLLLD